MMSKSLWPKYNGLQMQYNKNLHNEALLFLNKKSNHKKFLVRIMICNSIV